MIVYHPAFDLYHTSFRILQLLIQFNKSDMVEVDRLRIWDFYFLFPNKLHTIHLKKEEKDVKDLLKRFIPRIDNPYELFIDNRKMFEKIKPYQMMAIRNLASHGIIELDSLKEDKIKLKSKSLLETYSLKFQDLSSREKNILTLLTSHFYLVPMHGVDGLKDKTNLLESKYDAK